MIKTKTYEHWYDYIEHPFATFLYGIAFGTLIMALIALSMNCSF